MKKGLIQFLTAIAVISAIIILYPTDKNEYQRIPRGMGTLEDPNARTNFEWMKTRDPKTNKIPANIRTREIAFVHNIPSKSKFSGKGQFTTNTADWSWKGPANISGRTRAFRFDVTNGAENTIIAGGIAGGMWKSTDGGDTWVKKTRNDQLQSVSCVVQDPRPGFGNIWYYGTGEEGSSAGANEESAAYSGNGVFKSTDNGETWELLASTASNTPQTWDNSFDYIWNIEVDNQGNVYASCSGETQKSTDGGVTWNPILADGFSGKYSDFVITATGDYYSAYSSDAEQNAGIWKSTDGTIFTDITPANFPGSYNRVVMTSAPSNGKILYVLIDLGDDQTGLWKYTDGEGWEDRSSNLVLTHEQDKVFSTQRGYDQVISVKPDDENFVIIAGVDVWRSTDGFASTSDNRRIGGTGFGTLDYPNHFPDHHVIRFLPSNSKAMYVANDGGIYKTMDVTNDSPDASGVTVAWSFVSSKSYNTTLFFGIDIDKTTSGSEMIAGGMQDRGNFRRAAGSNDWPEVGGGDGMMSAVADGGSWFVSSTQSGAISRYEGSDYKTETWMKPTGSEGQLWVTPYYLDPSDNNVMYYAAGEFIWRNNSVTTADDQAGWTKLNNSQHQGEIITAIGVSKNNSKNVVYYGTADGKVYRLAGANSGDPAPTALDIPGEGSYVTSLYVDPENSNKVILAYSNYSVISVYNSTNGGGSWTNISGNLEQNADGSGDGPSVRWATFVDVNGTVNYFAGTSAGLYSTTVLNGTSTQWVKEGASSIGNSVVIMMIPREVDNYLAVATHGSGVFSATLTGGGAVNNPPTLTLTPNSPYTVAEGSQLAITLVGADPDAGAVLTYSATNKPEGSTLDALTGAFAWTPNMEQAGSYSVEFKVTDEKGASAMATAEITVTDLPAENTPPTLALDPTGPFEVVEGSMLSIKLVGSDSDIGDVLTYSSSNLPAGSTLDATTGAFAWTPNSEQSGSYSVEFKVADKAGASAMATAEITVKDAVPGNTPPTLALDPAGPYTVAEGDLLSIKLIGTDPDANSTLTYSATGMPDGATVDATTGQFAWTVGFDAAGEVTILFVVTDNNGATVIKDAVVTITNTNRPPSFTKTILPQELAIGVEFSFQYEGTDSDGDKLGFDLQDGPDGSSISETGLFKWMPSDAQAEGTYKIVVILFDDEEDVFDTATVTTGTITDIANFSGVPEVYSLKQNYPNPFNPSTMIKYGIPEQSNVKIEVFNMLGQSFDVLVNQDIDAGFYETTWNAENLPSGIYLISIRANGLNSNKNFTQVKKALLLK